MIASEKSRRLERRVQVQPGTEVSSIWDLPVGGEGRPEIGLILGHGAGNDMHSPLLSYVHERVAQAGILAIKFNFPYKERRAKVPDRPPVLEASWRALISSVRQDPQYAPRRLYCGGKSMGGRIASQVVADGVECAGLVFLGYPLHPPRRPQALRSAHLSRIACPMLFIQGTRDTLCDLQLLRDALQTVRAPARLHAIEGADHSFKVPKQLGRQPQEVWEEIVQTVLRWLHDTPSP